MSDGPTVSAVVLTFNEAENIAACLRRLQWADECLVLDSGSTDDTVVIARAAGARVQVRLFDDYARQRNAALALARGAWVLFVDADERVTPALAAEIRRAIESECLCAGYWIPRQNVILGRVVRHGGWYPDEQLRLLRRDRAHYDETKPVHEVVVLDGKSGHLSYHLIHHNYRRVRQLFAKQDRYATLEARELRRRGLRARPHNFVLQPLRQFRWRYWELAAFRDGWRGLALSLLLAAYTVVAYWRLWRLSGPSDRRRA
ncbi:MAG: glycosyltransferase family 2 protein [Chloroflexi bacterium]|nr:glycosyltransferase family 2 protein [Chloroflexota bacterium]